MKVMQKQAKYTAHHTNGRKANKIIFLTLLVKLLKNSIFMLLVISKRITFLMNFSIFDPKFLYVRLSNVEVNIEVVEFKGG